MSPEPSVSAGIFLSLYVDEKYIKFYCRSLKGSLDLDGRIILKWLIRKCGVKVSASFSGLRIVTSGDLL
jgi:hypothetical protein